MKVLIVSQPVLSSTNNMGKTLMGYFKGFPSGNIAQLFLRQGTPENAEVCERYYRFSDADAMKSIWNRSVRGTSFDKRTVQSAEKAASEKNELTRHTNWGRRIRHGCCWPATSFGNAAIGKMRSF